MNKRQKNSVRALVLQAALSLVLLFLGSIFFAFLFAAPHSGNSGSALAEPSFSQVSAATSPLGQSCTVDSWRATNTANVPSARSEHTAVWTGSEMIVWGGDSNTGGKYSPSTNSWTATSTTNAPGARYRHTAVWTGSEMIVWGGSFGFDALNTGGRYNPLTNSWTGTSVVNAPAARTNHVAVWTGTEMIVWGGDSETGCCPGGCCALNSGGKYNPATDSWTPITLTDAPSARTLFTAVWTGTEMIVWGGSVFSSAGGRYNPLTNSWTATSTVNAPSLRLLHTAVWTGSEMVVWGGTNSGSMNSGGRYNPATDSWTATSTTNVPVGRWGQTAVWTGSEMIVWGGIEPLTDTGGRYNPKTDSWIPTGTTSAPPARTGHTAVWDGNEMIVWGGYEDDGIPTPTSAPGDQPARPPGSIDAPFPDPPFPVSTGGRYCGPGAPTPTPSPTATATATPGGVAQAINLSTRLLVGTGDGVGIGGFIITGTSPKQVLLRGIGPSLGGWGVPNRLADPTLELRDAGGTLVASNDDWCTGPGLCNPQVIATGLPPTDALESAILVTLDPGAYTAIIRGKSDSTGVGLVEIYDLSQGSSSKLANISTRAFVSTGSDIVIAGFILGGGVGDDTVLLRGIGPSLATFGVPNALANPTLELRNGEGALVGSNDDWQNGPSVSLPPSDSLESALEVLLPPGAYTALLSGVNGGTGVGLVEVYDLGLP